MTVFIHVEEPSMESALDILLPRLFENREVTWKIIDHGSKQRLLRDLPSRFAGYVARLAREEIKVLVVVDRDDDDCLVLKQSLEDAASAAGLRSRSQSQGSCWQS